MKFKEALKILMKSVTRDLRGSGMGIRPGNEKDRQKVQEAYRRIFRYVYNRNMNSNDEFNCF